jgi:hypothetical protein
VFASALHEINQQRHQITNLQWAETIQYGVNKFQQVESAGSFSLNLINYLFIEWISNCFDEQLTFLCMN